MKPSLSALALALSLALPVRAQTLWEVARDPDAREALAALRQADALSREASDRRRIPPVRRRAMLTAAAELYDRAVAARPDDVAALVGAADTWSDLEDHPRAEALFQRALALAPEGPLAPDALFGLALVHTHQGHHEAARDAYLARLAFPGMGHSLSVTYGNLADEYTALRDLPHALEAYELCVAHDDDYPLGWLGLAVTRDRDGRADARDAAARALSTAGPWAVALAYYYGGPSAAGMAANRPVAILDQLDDPGVFYVPAYDRYYHLGVALEALDRDDPFGFVGSRTYRDAALSAWRSYVTAAPPGDPWLARARAHVEALSAPMPTGRARRSG